MDLKSEIGWKLVTNTSEMVNGREAGGKIQMQARGSVRANIEAKSICYLNGFSIDQGVHK